MAHSKCRVLVVEDDPDTRDTLVEALEAVGFHVEQAGTGLAALAFFTKPEPPDVMLLDLHLPDMTGAQVADRLHGNEVRIIFLTGDVSVRVMGLARSARLLTKPIDLRDLESAVSDACAA